MWRTTAAVKTARAADLIPPADTGKRKKNTIKIIIIINMET